MTRRRRHLLSDAVLYALSLGAHQASRAAAALRRRWVLGRDLRRFPGVTGRLEVLRPVVAPLSGEEVAACRLLVEQQLDDGTWTSLIDETQVADLELLGPEGRARLAGPAHLLAPASESFRGHAVHALYGGQRALPGAEDLRATEHRLSGGAPVHVFGLRRTTSAPGGPYRSGTALTLDRHPAARLLLISVWPASMLRRMVMRQPGLVQSLC
jgi:hypothetical protein